MEVTEMERAPELASSSASIDLFCDALWLEHGLAKNSLEAYRRDLRLFCRMASEDAWRHCRYRHRSRSERLYRRAPRRQGDLGEPAPSVFRRYYAWALREHRALADPTLKLRSAKQPPRFPATLERSAGRSAAGRARCRNRRSACATARCSN